MSILTRCDGPGCPNCGCQDVRILEEPKVSGGQVSWWGSGRARCNHCRRQFSFRELPQNAPAVEEPLEIAEEAEGVAIISREMVRSPQETEAVEAERRVVVVPKCPDCGGETKVSSTRKAFRWHKCVRCGKTMKTAR